MAVVETMISHSGCEDVRLEGFVHWQVVEFVTLHWVLSGCHCCCLRDVLGLGCCHILVPSLLLLSCFNVCVLLGVVGGCLCVCYFTISSHSVCEQINSVGDWNSVFNDCVMKKPSCICKR